MYFRIKKRAHFELLHWAPKNSGPALVLPCMNKESNGVTRSIIFKEKLENKSPKSRWWCLWSELRWLVAGHINSAACFAVLLFVFSDQTQMSGSDDILIRWWWWELVV